MLNHDVEIEGVDKKSFSTGPLHRFAYELAVFENAGDEKNFWPCGHHGYNFFSQVHTIHARQHAVYDQAMKFSSLRKSKGLDTGLAPHRGVTRARKHFLQS